MFPTSCVMLALRSATRAALLWSSRTALAAVVAGGVFAGSALVSGSLATRPARLVDHGCPVIPAGLQSDAYRGGMCPLLARPLGHLPYRFGMPTSVRF